MEKGEDACVALGGIAHTGHHTYRTWGRLHRLGGTALHRAYWRNMPFHCRIEQKLGSVKHPKPAKTGDVRAFTHIFAEGKRAQAIEKYKDE